MSTTLELLKASAVTQIQTDLAAAVAVSAGEAASSASTAINALALQFKGGIAGASVPATLPLAGDYHEIITAGFSAASGKTWAVGDKAVYNGSSGQWTQITGYFAPISSAITTLASFAGGYIQSDGATSNRASGIYGPFDAVNNPREYVAGAASLTDAMVIPVPTASSTAEIVGRSSSITALSSATAWSMGIAWSGNDLVIRCNGATPATDFRTVTFTGLRTTYSGQTILAKAAYTNGTTAPVFSVNGGTISGGTAANGGGTTPDWLSASMTPTYRLVGYNWPAGPAPIVTPILGTTSAADDAFYMQTGKWPAWVVAGGSAGNEILNASRNSNFSALATDFIAGSNCTVSAATGALIMTSIASGGNQYAQLATGFLRSGSLRFGNSFRVVGNVSANTTGGAIRISDSSGNQAFQLTASTGAFDVIITPTSSFWVGGFIVSSAVQPASVVSFTLASIALYPLGALSLPSVQPINVLDDVSGIGGNQGRLLGCSTVTDKRSTRILGRINAASATPQQILGGALFASPLNHAIEFVDVECDGSVTLSLGDGTTATRYTASTALTAGRTRIALTTPFAADAAKTGLYVNVTVAGGTYAQFSILGHLLK